FLTPQSGQYTLPGNRTLTSDKTTARFPFDSRGGQMKRILTGVFLALLVSIMTCGNVWAQAAAQIAGAVSDQSGAVLPGAEITATQVDTGVSRSTITNETGLYILPYLALGP